MGKVFATFWSSLLVCPDSHLHISVASPPEIKHWRHYLFSITKENQQMHQHGHLIVMLSQMLLHVLMYGGVSKRFETGSVEHQLMTVCECGCCGWVQGTLPLSMPSGVALWTLGVAQHQCLSPRVPARLRFQHRRETGAESSQELPICIAEQWGYILRNALLGDFIIVQKSYTVLTQI
jgi:hypothetical protein